MAELPFHNIDPHVTRRDNVDFHVGYGGANTWRVRRSYAEPARWLAYEQAPPWRSFGGDTR